MKTIRIFGLFSLLTFMACSSEPAAKKSNQPEDQTSVRENKDRSDSKSGFFPIILAGSIHIVQSLYVKKD